MIGNLTESEIKDLLHKEVIGRIGCMVNNSIYIVPVSYAYDDKNIYVHSYEGSKISGMREHPEVCFEVDDIRDMSSWKSVIAWGRFEEIVDQEERNEAVRILLGRTLPTLSSVTTHLGESWPFYSEAAEEIDGIIFKILIEKATGKFERTIKPSLVNG
jgi:nitroimidazol reductase NimA-like FMN-containing flavoprotein (pyridoxamine 5'-phosphate oxidase superfamily)